MLMFVRLTRIEMVMSGK